MNDYLGVYTEIRDEIVYQLDSMVEVSMCKIWDPLMSHLIVKEIKKGLTKSITIKYPDFPKSYIPHIRLKTYPESQSIETAVQIFFNTDSDLIYLSSTEYSGAYYDLYCCKSWDPKVPYVFYARYGHELESLFKGDKEAAKDYLTGVVSPLSLAFEMAVYDGLIA
jgi:hypothetical protein